MNPTRHRIDLVCFDLDGTLVDTAAEIAEAVNRTLEAHAIARRRPDEIALLIGAGAQALMRRLHVRCVAEDAALAQRVPLQALLDGMEHHSAAVTGLLAHSYPDCLDALARLRGAGVQLACVTNKEARHAHRVLQATGLADAFGLVVGGDSLAHAKPDARVLQHVARHFGIPLDRTAHVGDSSVDVQAAHNAGVHAWAVPYGYNAGVPVAQAGPDRLFDSLGAVADHVLESRGD